LGCGGWYINRCGGLWESGSRNWVGLSTGIVECGRVEVEIELVIIDDHDASEIFFDDTGDA
jgi:hypothetical protein